MTRPSSVVSAVAGELTSSRTPRSSADLTSRATSAGPFTSCIPRRAVTRSNTWNATRQAACANPRTEVVACRKACRSGPAMMPMPSNEVSYSCGRSSARSSGRSRRALIGFGPTERPPVPAPGRSPWMSAIQLPDTNCRDVWFSKNATMCRAFCSSASTRGSS